MFSYCGNNPVGRADTKGKLWGAVLGAIAVQYAADVLGNFIDGKTGVELFYPTSSIADYAAAGMTALIPGSKFIHSLQRSVISEGVRCLDNYLQGKATENNLRDSICRVIRDTALDVGVGYLFKKVDDAFATLANKNPATRAVDYIKKGSSKTLSQGISRVRISNTLGRISGAIVSATCNVVYCYLSPD